MNLSAIIIDGRQRARRIDASESHPRSLDIIDDSERPVLDWTLRTLEQAGVTDPLYVGGYHIEKVMELFPNLRVRYHASNDGEGELAVLLQYAPTGQPLLVMTASTILLPGSIERLTACKIARGTYGGLLPVGAYFFNASLVGAVLEQAHRLLADKQSANLDVLFDEFPDVSVVDLDGFAAPVTDQEAVARAIFRGKAQTLDNLATTVKGVSFLPRERITLTEWQRDPNIPLARVKRTFAGDVVVVRSSVSGEDGLHESSAGKYLSVLNVAVDEGPGLRQAINDVVESYGVAARQYRAEDEILIQPQLRNVAASGVLLTRDPRTGAPYFVINEDRASGQSNLVTSGTADAIIQRFVAWCGTDASDLDDQTRRLIGLANELIRLSRLDALDIEYAVDDDGVLHLLQVRPLAAARRRPETADDDVLDLVVGARAFVDARMRPVNGLVGRDTVLGVMPDWNPAEMIGSTPRPLALSLYQSLIGQDSWADARRRMGYRDVRPEPLIVSLAGHPYVDVRASLNSFIPVTVDDATAAQWVDACLDMLRADPALHDKIEFEIAITCLAPDWDASCKRLTRAKLDASAYAGHLRKLTSDIVSGRVEPIDRQLELLRRLGERRERHLDEMKGGIHDTARLVSHVLTDCRRLGVVPFSVLARYAFISMSFLRGLLRAGVIDDMHYHAFLRALPTVASSIARDLRSRLSRSELVARYGHLRPNSYEITSPNYETDPGHYLRIPSHGHAVHSEGDAEAILMTRSSTIRRVLDHLGLDVEVAQLASFLCRSISMREQAKFEFMKSLNAALEGIANLGDLLNLDREKMSFLQVSDVVRLETDSIVGADRIQLRRRAAYNEKRWSAARVLRLPDVICSAENVVAFRLEAWRANFITRKRVEARAVWLDDEATRPDLSGAIVIIRAADPGYDWIFAHGIAGLVTEYGGVASHMSIRAAEFGLPAAIGCGAVVFETLRGAQKIELDCAAERVRRLPC